FDRLDRMGRRATGGFFFPVGYIRRRITEVKLRVPRQPHHLEFAMNQVRRFAGAFALLACCALLLPPSAGAQGVTTASVTGLVKDASGGVIPGASVTAVHEPSGTSYDTVTQSDGRFTIPGMRVGGPYTVKAELSGFT